MTEEEKKKQSGTVEYVPTYGQFAAAQNAGNAASNIASGIMPMTYARGGAYTPTTATPTVVKYNLDEPGGTTPETTPGTTPETTPTTKYADNVDGLTVRQMIEEQRKASYADAEKLRERSVIDASTAYAQNKATYGANAEALAGMGLTGGGYGDYLNSRAYAQQREEIQAARAGEAAAKREADRVYYADMMAQKEKEDAAAKAEADKSNAAFIDLLAQAKTGNYTAEDIKNMAAKAGITNQADIDALTSAATTAQSNVEIDKSNKQNAAYAEGLAMAESGDYSEATIEAWAKGKGITDQTMIDALKKAAKVAAQKKDIGNLVTPETTDEEINQMVADGKLYPENVQAAKDARDGEKGEATDKSNKQNAAYAEGLVMIESGNGNISAATIEAWAKGKGITDQTMIDALKKAAKTAKEANERENISGNISADTTDEEISNMIISGELSESNRAEAEKTRTEAAADEISALVDAKNYEGADALVEKYYQSGAYDTDDRQNYYMDKSLNFIDESKDLKKDLVSISDNLTKLKNEGKISNEDYRKAMQYACEKATSMLVSGKDTGFKLSGTDFSITINGKEYKGSLSTKASTDAEGSIQTILGNAMGGYPKEGSIALYDDGVYVYATVNGKAAWYKASRNWLALGNTIFAADNNRKIYEALQGVAKTRKDPTRPEHKAAK